MRHLRSLLIGCAILGLGHLSIHAQDKGKEKEKQKPKDRIQPAAVIAAPNYRHLDGRRIVIVFNGVKDSTNASDNLMEVNSDRGLGLLIVQIPWSRYDNRIDDIRDNEAQLNAAVRGAALIAAIRKDAPHAQIFLLGWSAGGRIALVAAEMSAPKSIDRIILMHAAVSNRYDLGGAFKASRFGIDNFYSNMDGVLEIAGADYCLADGMKGPAAGYSGFVYPCTDKKELAAYRNLRQRGWDVKYAGNGGHCAWVLVCNMDRVMVPIFDCTPAYEPVMVPPPTKIEKKKGPMPKAD